MIPFHISSFLKSTILLVLIIIGGAEDDTKCLQGVKSSLRDPDGSLALWDFQNTTSGFICKFTGVTCWNDNENRVINLALQDMNLGGVVPGALQNCHNLQSLDLSGNGLSGTIPSQICHWLPYLVTLDLSNNHLTGKIPPDLVSCQYLNSLALDGNKLTGNIPSQLSSLGRLKKFSVANNDLSGRLPSSFDSSDPSVFDFAGTKLCGGPAGKCGGLSKKNLAIIIAAGVFGAAASMLLGFGMWYWYFTKSANMTKRGYSWVGIFRDHKLAQVVLFQKPLVKLKLVDLLAATNNFGEENIISSTKTGTTYKAVLRDGSALAIKRLSYCKVGEKHFRVEVNRLGQLRHPNLVPLLGFCTVEEEKLLVYKHLSNGTLYSVLHGNPSMLDWPTRFRIGLGASRGLAWLHHGCQPPIIHQNFSSHVILLDEDFDARIMDFGSARLLMSAATSSNANESSFVNGNAGEFGYVAPEYASTMIPSTKGDTYSFGVVLLELATGQKPLEVSVAEEGLKGNLVEWVNRLMGSGRVKDAIDKSLCGKGNDEEIVQFLRIACHCVVSQPKDRWSMYQVSEALKKMAAAHHGVSEQYDEFPLILNEQDMKSSPMLQT
ncbi:unnamed protein product [Cuscuta europaea]|uniref:Protein kinase domain-containing protein n=1 Tax=Cuscuta europaea TaxID=41803 RepID=A0A9P1E7A7_CUSEU|nr:unnamed protein product [Cuscuta europaea]